LDLARDWKIFRGGTDEKNWLIVRRFLKFRALAQAIREFQG
jgi:hypothetical protein